MKIRTKLLLTLALISLFPPFAAYVALIGDPAISFALRMNEYEAKQGVAAQKLQTDLNVIVSAVEESLGETFRIRIQPKENEDAKRQIGLANSTLLSGAAAYEADLAFLAQSENQQVQDTLASGSEKNLPAFDQREMRPLKALSDSLPVLKSNVGKFIQLSDSHPATLGDFVREVFEPQVRGELSSAVQELAADTDQSGLEYRRNIEKALKSSYKETILIVLLGLLVSMGLAALVSHAVIGPIQELRDAAGEIGRGKMDVRIPIRSKDELSELADSFNLMADNLTNLMAERGRAQSELSQVHEGLKHSMGELESRNRQAATLSEMADLLQACFDVKEASSVIAFSAQKLFPGFSGAVLVFSASRDVLEEVATWGRPSSAERVFGPNDCWALRRGRLHHSSSEKGTVRCPHLGEDSHQPAICTPLMAHGETLGILCLVTESTEIHGAPASISEYNVQLAVSVAGHAALSFANLKLREKLRLQSIRDPLTGLFNRRYLDESMERELASAMRGHRGLGIIMLDVDQFKKFNDLFGHDAGDAVLRELGLYLAQFIRRGDLACRYGGEEFTLILPESTLEDTRRRAEELRTSFHQLTIKHGDVVLGKVTLSMGVAALPDNGTTAAELLAAADTALLRAKEEGRDRVLVAGSYPHPAA